MKDNHKHEWRQKFRINGHKESLQENGFYCIHCLIEVKNKEELDKLK